MPQSIPAFGSVGFRLPAGSELTVTGPGTVHITQPGQNVRELVLGSSTQLIGPYREDVVVSLSATTQPMSWVITVGYGTVGDPVTVPNISGIGVTLTAALAPGWLATSWQWKRVAPNGTVTDISGATSATYTQQAADIAAGTRIYPQPIGLTFAPYGITAEGTVAPGVNPGTLQFAAGTFQVGESAGTVAIQVSRAGGTDGAASVQVSTAPGTASAGSDFTSTTQTLNWANGEGGSKTVNVPILNDTAVEGNETFTVNLANAIGATIGSPNTATVTIVDDDTASAGTIQFSSSTYSVGEGASGVTIIATRIGGSTGAASVGYATSNGTATAGSDYTATSGTLNWADGDAANKTFVVPITDDSTVESSETFTVALSSVTGATLGSPATATVTITDNDVAPDTRARYGNGPSNATGDASVFASIFSGMSPLSGSTNGARAGGVTMTGSTTSFGWVAFPASAGNAAHMTDANGFTGGWSGANSNGLYGGTDNDPIDVTKPWTDPATGIPWIFIRSNGRPTQGSTFTLS